MTTDVNQARAEAEAFKQIIETKIHRIVEEFAEGKLSREQFQVLYERYNGRLSIANQALVSGTPEAIKIAQGGPSTLMVKDTYMGRAMGLVAYHNTNNIQLESLGEFTISAAHIAKILVRFAQQRASGKFIERHVEKIKENQWLLMLPGQTTTIGVRFENEPSQQQIREIARLQHDYERVNDKVLAQSHVDELAAPLVVFVRKWSQSQTVIR